MNIITRAEWGPRYGQGHRTDGAKTLVVVHHDGPYPSRSRPGMSLEEEIAIMRAIENYHVNGEKGKPGLTATNPRIAYSFMGTQTGRCFEGCGWDHIGAHTGGLNSSSYGYFLPLAGNRDAPTVKAIATFHLWRAEGIRLGKLSKRHLVKGHQDYNKPACPGKLVYDAMVLGVEPLVLPTVPDIIAAHPTLRRGKGGMYALAAERSSVKYLQSRLDMAQEFRTGFFGDKTHVAVLAFQRKHNLKPDGIVGPETWAVLDRFADVSSGSSTLGRV